MAVRGHATRDVDAGWLVRYVIPTYVGLVAVAVAVVVVGRIAVGLAPGVTDGCKLHVGAALAGSADFFARHVAPGCDLLASEARATISWDFAFVLVYAPLGTLALRWLWPRAWRIALLRSRLSWATWLPVLTGLLDAVENVLVMWGLSDGDGGLVLSDSMAAAAGVAGWWKWVAAAGAVLASAGALGGWVANRSLPLAPAPHPGDAPVPPIRDDTGICLAGGGMRAAAFSWGALRSLDRRKVLRRARWVSAVSGAAFAAGAWFVARAERDATSVPPRPDDPDPVLDPPSGAPRPGDYLRDRRRFLSGGRGGLPATVLIAVGGAVFNVIILATLVYLVAWPVGRALASWVVQPELGAGGSLEVARRLWLPGVAALAASVMVFLASLALWDPARSRSVRTARSLGLAALALLAFLVGAPIAMAEAPGAWDRLLSGEVTGEEVAWALAAVAVLVVVGAFLRGRNARRRGGLVLALVALGFAGKVASDAAYDDGPFASSPLCYGLVLLAFVLTGTFGNVQAWSLFRLLSARLRTAIATTQDARRRARGAPAHAGTHPLSPAAEREWSAYRERRGPQLVACATAQSGPNEVTGVPALTVAFSSGSVALREVDRDTDGAIRSVDTVVPVDAYLARLGGGRLGTVSAAAALSGGGAGPRTALGTSGSLLTALNVRAGAWMPNPRYVSEAPPKPFKRPRLGYLLKELLALYDPDDPYLYVTGAGAWENGALVELVRRRCRWIFCVDATADGDAALDEARTTARLECGAEIDLDTSQLSKPAQGLPERAVTVGLVRYHTCGGAGRDGCEIGLLFYGRALLARDTPVNALSFSSKDRLRPRRTFDPFLPADEFDNHVRLGEWIGRAVALEYGRLTEALAAGSASGLEGSPALLEAYERFTGAAH